MWARASLPVHLSPCKHRCALATSTQARSSWLPPSAKATSSWQPTRAGSFSWSPAATCFGQSRRSPWRTWRRTRQQTGQVRSHHDPRRVHSMRRAHGPWHVHAALTCPASTRPAHSAVSFQNIFSAHVHPFPCMAGGLKEDEDVEVLAASQEGNSVAAVLSNGVACVVHAVAGAGRVGGALVVDVSPAMRAVLGRTGEGRQGAGGGVTDGWVHEGCEGLRPRGAAAVVPVSRCPSCSHALPSQLPLTPCIRPCHPQLTMYRLRAFMRTAPGGWPGVCGGPTRASACPNTRTHSRTSTARKVSGCGHSHMWNEERGGWWSRVPPF